MINTESELDIRLIEPRLKHPSIFEVYDNLKPGETFVIINDHNPKPLKYELAAERGSDKFSWEYLEEGPEVWKVRIGKIAN